jgi:putative peptidoglycan lipid II flippase
VRLGAAAGKVSAATMISRVTGLLRETVSAALFGFGPLSDALVFAFRIPNLLREFFAEGALSAAFVPVFAKARADEGEGRAFLLASRVFGTLAAVTGLLVVAGVVFAPEVVGLVAADAPEAQRPLTVLLTRLMFPFLLLAALAAAVMGVLNTHQRWFLPALAPALFNVVAVLGGAVLLLLGTEPETALVVWALLVVAGGLAQLLVQVPALRAVGYRGRPRLDLRLRDPLLATVAKRMGPVVLALAGTNVMVVITTAVASRGEGWATALGYAFRLVHLPIGVVGVSIGMVVLAAGSRAHAERVEGGLDDLVRRGLRLAWFLALPAAVGLFVLAEPLVRMVYGYGRFGDAGVLATAEALRWYAAAVVGYAGVKAAAPQVLARGDTRTPMLCSLAGIGVNIAVALLLVERLEYRALALAVVLGTATNFLLLRALGVRRHGRASRPGWAATAKIAGAAAAMGAAGAGLLALLPAPGLVLTLAMCAGLAALYFAVAALVGLPEAAAFARRLGLSRGPGAPPRP